MRSDSKILEEHRKRAAYIYVRQSSPGQVLTNLESGRMQRELVELAQALGWPPSRIALLDGDTGKSASTSRDREAFKRICGDVSVGEVGIVIGLQLSRLARNSADWFPLVEMCALTDTLIADEEGVYDANDPNDRLILGFKGTLFEAELYRIRAQLQRARWSKARRGELRRKIPVGYVWDQEGRVVLDPDERVRSALRYFFERFKDEGSACRLARRFQCEGLLFPHRDYRGRWDGPIVWKPLGVRWATQILHNPFYAGVYFYGRKRAKTILDPETKTRKTVMRPVPMESWEVLIHDAHPAYISFEEFLRNQERLRENWFMREGGRGSERTGVALLAGIAYCGKCGRRMMIHYSGRKPYVSYMCRRVTDLGERAYCQTVPAERVDPWVEEKLLEAINPVGIAAAIGAAKELERRSEELKRQWEHRIEQGEYQARLARRRYEGVDPENRLVAGNLEREWEKKLREVEDLRKEYQERSGRPPIRITEEDLRRVQELTGDIPRLWRAKTTKASDRKKILRILIRDVWLFQEDDPWQTGVRIHWQSGAVTVGELERPLPIDQRVKTSEEVLDRVRELWAQGRSREEIAQELNREGLKSGRRMEFNVQRVTYVLRRWNLCQGKTTKGRHCFRTADHVVERLRELHLQGKTPREIAEQANREGLRTGMGNPLTALRVKYFLWTRHITGAPLGEEHR